jgi:3-deoxy-D-manno-octulosonate 8-phosphate phosphatase (KDO 8-P phosphatase)
MTRPAPASLARKVKLLLMDVDGVLTDGRLFYFETRAGVVEETKGFDSKDGIGLLLAREVGLRTGFISGRRSSGVEERAKLLGVEFVYQGAARKMPAYSSILAETNLKDEEIAYVGDDLPDLPILRRVGLPAAVADAVPEVLKAARYVTRKKGGHGAVREVVELILKARGLWDAALRKRGILEDGASDS